MWNKLLKLLIKLNKSARWVGINIFSMTENKKKPEPMTIEERIKNSKDYQNKLNKRR